MYSFYVLGVVCCSSKEKERYVVVSSKWLSRYSTVLLVIDLVLAWVRIPQREASLFVTFTLTFNKNKSSKKTSNRCAVK